ncbi:MAG: alkaline phosphatase [Clostridia bacterium]|nr:alkaline phosphatase [Clostridia bacterium]
MLKRITALLLALITIFALVGCQPAGSTDSTADSNNQDGTSGDVTQPEAAPIELTAELLAEYVIRRPENVKNESIEASIQAAKKLRESIKSELGVDVQLLDDWYNKSEGLPETAKEILVGKTNRTEAQNIIASIKAKDYAIAFENDRIIITGGTDDACAKAVDYFIENYIDAANKKISLTEHMLDVVAFNYPMGNISINGVSLREYKIVRPKKCDLITYYTAEVISDYIFNNAGYKLEVIDDSKAETAYELLVGDTNRSASNIGISLSADQYSLSISEGKVVMQGDYRMVGAAASTLINTYFGLDGKDVDVTNLPTAPAAAEFTFKKATSGIMMIGDGMSAVHFAAAIDTGVIPEFVADTLPYKAECTTASYSVIHSGKAYTDSAASATALSSGYKTVNGYVGVNPKKQEKQNIRELAHEFGAKTAVVTTDKITGATPSGYLCHYPDRDATAQLQSQIDNLKKNGLVDYTYGAASNNGADLTKFAREALSVISDSDKGFFIMIEEAYIDKNSHNNDLTKTTKSVKIYNDVIAYCIAYTMVRGDVMLVITADHDCGNLSKKPNGDYIYNATNHTNKNVPVFALGDGAAELINKDVIDNTDIPKAFAKIFGNNNFGS